MEDIMSETAKHPISEVIGLTMQKGYGGLPDLLRENLQPDDAAKTLMKAN